MDRAAPPFQPFVDEFIFSFYCTLYKYSTVQCSPRIADVRHILRSQRNGQINHATTTPTHHCCLNLHPFPLFASLFLSMCIYIYIYSELILVRIFNNYLKGNIEFLKSNFIKKFLLIHAIKKNRSTCHF